MIKTLAQQIFSALVSEIDESQVTKVRENGVVHDTYFLKAFEDDETIGFIMLQCDGRPVALASESKAKKTLSYGPVEDEFLSLILPRLYSMETFTISKFTGKGGTPLEIKGNGPNLDFAEVSDA